MAFGIWCLKESEGGLVRSQRLFQFQPNLRLVCKRISGVTCHHKGFQARVHPRNRLGVAIRVEAVGSYLIKHHLRHNCTAHLVSAHGFIAQRLADHLAFGRLDAELTNSHSSTHASDLCTNELR
jgi:hypothetical protein